MKQEMIHGGNEQRLTLIGSRAPGRPSLHSDVEMPRQSGPKLFPPLFDGHPKLGPTSRAQRARVEDEQFRLLVPQQVVDENGADIHGPKVLGASSEDVLARPRVLAI